jgi:replicative DNA helicase
MKIYDVLKGGFLVDEGAFKNWRIILFIVFLLLFMISSSHSADRKVMEISRMNNEMKKLKSLYIDSGTYLTRMKMESSVREKLKERGLGSPKTPPIKIKVTTKTN